MNLSLRLNRLRVLSCLGIATSSAVSIFLPIDMIKRADCTLGYQCGLYHQSEIIAAVYGLPVNLLHRMSFDLMLLVYVVTLIVFTKRLKQAGRTHTFLNNG